MAAIVCVVLSLVVNLLLIDNPCRIPARRMIVIVTPGIIADAAVNFLLLVLLLGVLGPVLASLSSTGIGSLAVALGAVFPLTLMYRKSSNFHPRGRFQWIIWVGLYCLLVDRYIRREERRLMMELLPSDSKKHRAAVDRLFEIHVTGIVERISSRRDENEQQTALRLANIKLPELKLYYLLRYFGYTRCAHAMKGEIDAIEDSFAIGTWNDEVDEIKYGTGLAAAIRRKLYGDGSWGQLVQFYLINALSTGLVMHGLDSLNASPLVKFLVTLSIFLALFVALNRLRQHWEAHRASVVLRTAERDWAEVMALA